MSKQIAQDWIIKFKFILMSFVKKGKIFVPQNLHFWNWCKSIINREQGNCTMNRMLGLHMANLNSIPRTHMVKSWQERFLSNIRCDPKTHKQTSKQTRKEYQKHRILSNSNLNNGKGHYPKVWSILNVLSIEKRNQTAFIQRWFCFKE